MLQKIFIIFVFIIFSQSFKISAQVVVPEIEKTTHTIFYYIERYSPSLTEIGEVVVDGVTDIFVYSFEILYLPLGVVQVVIGFPFGFLDKGIYNIKKGVYGIGHLLKTVIYFPFEFLGCVLPIFK